MQNKMASTSWPIWSSHVCSYADGMVARWFRHVGHPCAPRVLGGSSRGEGNRDCTNATAWLRPGSASVGC